jgi:hypothetical protein
MHHGCILRDMKMLLCFLCGAAVLLGFNVLHGGNSSHHVYELRLYHVHEGKMDALKARSRLIVIKLDRERSAVIGHAEGANEDAEAKQIADRARPK